METQQMRKNIYITRKLNLPKPKKEKINPEKMGTDTKQEVKQTQTEIITHQDITNTQINMNTDQGIRILGKQENTTKMWQEINYAELAPDKVWLCNLCTTTHNAYTNARALLQHFNRTHKQQMPAKKQQIHMPTSVKKRNKTNTRTNKTHKN